MYTGSCGASANGASLAVYRFAHYGTPGLRADLHPPLLSLMVVKCYQLSLLTQELALLQDGLGHRLWPCSMAGLDYTYPAAIIMRPGEGSSESDL